MRSRLATWTAACALGFAAALPAAAPGAAQDLIITNAHILDGLGGEIDSGSIVIQGGEITAVGPGMAEPRGAEVIDAEGRTVTPGFIDAHRHIIGGAPDAWLADQAAADMQGFLDAGFTAVQSGADAVPTLVALREQIAAGEVAGPRLVVSAVVPLATGGPAPGGGGDPARNDPARIPVSERETATQFPPDQARALVQAAAEQGADNIKTFMTVTPGGGEIETLRAIAEEAEAQGMRSVTHATSVDDMIASLEGGTHVLMHTPHIGWLDETDGAQMAADAGVPVVTTLGVFTPFFTEDGEALFRDRGPFEWGALHSGGQGPVNERALWNAGVVVGYGTDTTWPPRDSLRHELRALVSVFSNQELVQILTHNAAIAAGIADDTGSLEVGKAADIVMLDGDPYADINAVLDVAMVLRNGEVVVDNR